MLRWGYIVIPQRRVDITFDQNFERDPSMADLYEYIGSLKEWEFNKHLGKLSFANYRQEPGIQVADLLARETMKHMQNTMLASRDRWTRQSFMKLNANPRFHLRFVEKEEMLYMHSHFPSKLPTTFNEDYTRWRHENGIQADSMISKLRFMRLLRAQKASTEDEESDTLEL